MAIRFAHMSDVHLGAFREKELRELNIRAFEKAVDVCVEKNADFVVIAGDFFDIALPEMGVIDRAVRKMREAQARGMRFYLVYGSHDYSPTETSVIDVLCSAGVLVKVSGEETGADGVKTLKVFKDEKTGVSFAGVSARARGLEEAEFQKIDFSVLESVPNPKIFVFHSAVSEYTREEFHGFAGGVSVNSLPKGFDYYATGHVHLPQVIRDPALQNKPLVFPGPLFASDYRDLEALANEKHGFWFCTLESGACNVERVELDACRVVFLQYDASGKDSSVVEGDLLELVSSQDLQGKVVLLRVAGILSSGSPKDVNFSALREKANSRGALVFYLNRNALESREREVLVSSPADAWNVEEELFAKSLESLSGVSQELKGSAGILKSKALLSALKTEQAGGESKADFDLRIARVSKEVLGA
ncbi:MAG: metallophosphoesterase [Candidatus Norongarragalinales archaeon]